jgi:predicted MarR family transcription regulator
MVSIISGKGRENGLASLCQIVNTEKTPRMTLKLKISLKPKMTLELEKTLELEMSLELEITPELKTTLKLRRARAEIVGAMTYT